MVAASGVAPTRDFKAAIAEVDANPYGAWTVNGAELPQITGCQICDLGFTPATNFLPVRRLALRIGEEAQAHAAYLTFPQLRFEVLPQRYKRISDTEYEYQSPGVGYSGTLVFSAQGVIVSYPGLFLIEHVEVDAGSMDVWF
ncbi:putative glycolipid-binding domain-containing protein [Desulfonatronum thiosulfatophilum]|uniref:putative glycolipid-binding domain-containing protein n=1 Tax=Desulfonatronum thiosulfatophilum TaxID=617002 RepID=UPI0013796289|nr:putative glycolipid-binding domain-containing protein [Desulfonatronum thiosulfatophilum]